MRLIVGLGNPGMRYERTRHNAGYLVIDELARETQSGPWSIQCQSLVCAAAIAREQALLAKPLTFMNVSGRAVQHLLAETRGALHRYEQQKRMAVIAEALADIDGLIAAGSFDAALDALDEAERKHGSFREARALRHSLTRAIKER